MKPDTSIEVVQRLQSLIQRETGAPLGAQVETEMVHVVRQALGLAGDELKICSESREVTILMADLRGFTALSATQPAGIIIDILNRCLARMSEVIFRYEGTIDKFMGDAIMVLFGAPAAHSHDVAQALACAAEMQIAMCELNAENRRENLPELALGIGVNTGLVMAGRFGSNAYSEYTVIGNEVNLASRIEAFSLRGQVLIGENTYERCENTVVASSPMEVYVKGKAQPVLMRELVEIPSRNLKVPRQEIRRSHRVQVKLPCTYFHVEAKIVLPHPTSSRLWDIGYNGVLVENVDNLQLYDELKIEFDLPLVDFHAAELYAKVVNVNQRDGVPVAGIEFTAIPPETNSKIQMFVQLLVIAH
jgi:adenylate cyclase